MSELRYTQLHIRPRAVVQRAMCMSQLRYMQAYMIGVGDSIDEVKLFYVVINRARYKFEFPLRALDICFKIFFVWNINFPVSSKQIWTLLQYALYKFKTESDDPLSFVIKLIQNLGYDISFLANN